MWLLRNNVNHPVAQSRVMNNARIRHVKVFVDIIFIYRLYVAPFKVRLANGNGAGVVK